MCRLLSDANGKGYVVKIVDSFLDDKTYLDLLELAGNDQHWVLVDKEGTASKYEMELPDYLVKDIEQQYRSKIINRTEFGIDPQNFKAGLVKCEPGYWYPHHKDHATKVISTVVYLSPKEAPATIFLGSQSPCWRTNRLVAWKNEGQVHWYKNDTEFNRYTLNIYQMNKETLFVVE